MNENRLANYETNVVEGVVWNERTIAEKTDVLTRLLINNSVNSVREPVRSNPSLRYFDQMSLVPLAVHIDKAKRSIQDWDGRLNKILKRFDYVDTLHICSSSMQGIIQIGFDTPLSAKDFPTEDQELAFILGKTKQNLDKAVVVPEGSPGNMKFSNTNLAVLFRKNILLYGEEYSERIPHNPQFEYQPIHFVRYHPGLSFELIPRVYMEGQFKVTEFVR